MFSVSRKCCVVTMVPMVRRILSLVLVSALSLSPALSSPHRQNSKRMSIWDAVPDNSFRSGEIPEGVNKTKYLIRSKSYQERAYSRPGQVGRSSPCPV